MKNSDRLNIIVTSSYNVDGKLVSLNDLREKLRERRHGALVGPKSSRKVGVHEKDLQSLQPAAHYRSFEFDKMGAEQAIEIYNSGGEQKARLTPSH